MGPRLIGREDEDVSAEVRTILEGEGVDFRLASQCLGAERDGTGVSVSMNCDGRREKVSGSHLLLAIGRTPNTGDLNLPDAGVTTDDRGYITVDEELRTNVLGIWALGEANGRGAFTHTAYNDYEIVAANLLDGERRLVNELLDKIAYALIGASREKLLPGSSAPFFGASLTYQISLGIEDGDVVWSDPEMIAFDEEGLQVFWAQNAGEANERKVVWANTVSQMFEDELLNGDDDNGNGLADELGLSFVLDGDSVTIRLTLERSTENGGRIQETRSTTVTCRN
jgi:hypothetical protein